MPCSPRNSLAATHEAQAGCQKSAIDAMRGSIRVSAAAYTVYDCSLDPAIVVTAALVLRNGRLVYADGRIVEGGLVCEDGAIVAVFEGDPPEGWADAEEIDAGGRHVLPGAHRPARAALRRRAVRALRDGDAVGRRSAA